MKLKKVLISVGLLTAGIALGAGFLTYSNSRKENNQHNIDLAFSQIRAKLPNFSRQVSPTLLYSKKYDAALHECEVFALHGIKYAQSPDAGRPLDRFEPLGSEATFDDGNVVIIEITGASQQRHLFGCYLNSDNEAMSGRFLLSEPVGS